MENLFQNYNISLIEILFLQLSSTLDLEKTHNTGNRVLHHINLSQSTFPNKTEEHAVLKMFIRHNFNRRRTSSINQCGGKSGY